MVAASRIALIQVLDFVRTDFEKIAGELVVDLLLHLGERDHYVSTQLLPAAWNQISQKQSSGLGAVAAAEVALTLCTI